MGNNLVNNLGNKNFIGFTPNDQKYKPKFPYLSEENNCSQFSGRIEPPMNQVSFLNIVWLYKP